MRCLLLTTVLLLVQGCGGTARAPVEGKTTKPANPATVTSPDRSFYTVVAGDTLYSVAWRYQLDYRQLARWNDIGSSYLIHPGVQLTLRKPARFTLPARDKTKPRAVRKAVRREVSQLNPRLEMAKTPSSKSTVQQAPAVIKGSVINGSKPLNWRWPTKGKHRKTDSPTGKKGLQILGAQGQSVIAAGPGLVVYSGSGLIGYGKLIIIKHNDVFLSAYAHNDSILVEEGAEVAAGQKIAKMGSSGAKEVMLHFEIRRNGKPVPPLDYLPRS